MNKKDIYLFDDIFDKNIEKEIENFLLNPSFPWYYQPKSTGVKHSKLIRREESYFSHIFFHKERANSSFYDDFFLPTFSPIFDEVISFFKKDGYDMIRAKSNYYKKTNNIFEYRSLPLHVDYPYEHLTLLYYVVNSDGPTIFETGDKVNPKKGRLVAFDGSIRHSNKVPVFRDRIVININLRIK